MKAFRYTIKDADGSEGTVVLNETEAYKLCAAMTKDLYGTEAALDNITSGETLTVEGKITQVYKTLSGAPTTGVYMDVGGDLWCFRKGYWHYFSSSINQWESVHDLTWGEIAAHGPFTKQLDIIFPGNVDVHPTKDWYDRMLGR